MFVWNEHNMETLRSMWGQHSASVIAEAIGAVSRNAIIGKAARIGLTRRGPVAGVNAKSSKPLKQRKAVARPRVPAEASRKILPPIFEREHLPPPIATSIARPDPLNMRLLELASPERRGGTDCRYIVSDGGEAALFCGHNTAEGSPYCDYHRRVCYQPRENLKKVKI